MMLKFKNLFKKKTVIPIDNYATEKDQMDANNLIVDDEATPVANRLEEKELEQLKPVDDIKEQNFVTTTTGSTTNTTDVDISSEGVILEIPLQEKSRESLKDTPMQVDAESYDSDSFSSESEEPDEDFSEQAELSDYKLLNKIGEGAFSRVFRATPQRDTSKAFLTRNFSEVAVKVISKKHLTSQKDSKSKVTSKEQVLKEVAIHKAVSSSKNVVTFVDFQETQNYYFIVQELLAGGEIFGEIVRLTYFSEDLSRHVIKQLALAVKDMHSQGIVHRDIKPENLLFERIEYIPSSQPKLRKSDDPKTKQDEGVFRPGVGGGGIGVVKLADFGLSKQIYSTNTKTPCGTVGYTAPEVVKDERYSMQVDMWGIGCVLYTVLCGFPPFYDERVDVLTEKISRGEYTFLRPWWDEISDGAKYAVRKLLEVDPEKRYDIDEFLADPWLNQYDCLRQQTLKKHKNHSMENVHAVSSKKKKHRHQRWAFKKDSSLMYSPAAVAMRDAFEINNAVQRKEEDKRMTPGGVNLGQLQEDEETELEQDMFQLRLNSSTIIKRRKNKDTVKIPLTLNE